MLRATNAKGRDRKETRTPLCKMNVEYEVGLQALQNGRMPGWVDQSCILGELRQLAIRSHFVPYKRMGEHEGARLVCPLGCAAFEDNMASSNHVTKENLSLHVATLS